MGKSSIEWTERTWNPTVGCSDQSTGCKNCYAKFMAYRFQSKVPAYEDTTEKDQKGNVKWTGRINFSEKALLIPLKRKIETIWFVNSMSDLFHKNVPFEVVDKVFAVMALTPHHTYQILTKNPKRMLEYFNTKYRRITIFSRCKEMVIENNLKTDMKLSLSDAQYFVFPLSNVWLGTSIENQDQANKRLPYLLQVPAAVRFVSMEPLLGDVDLESIKYTKDNEDFTVDALSGITWFHPELSEFEEEDKKSNKLDWVIVGGESGHNARPMHPEWVKSIQRQCESAKVPFFFKQWGSYVSASQMPDDLFRHIQDNGSGIGIGDIPLKVGKHEAGNFLNGKQYLEMPIPKK